MLLWLFLFLSCLSGAEAQTVLPREVLRISVDVGRFRGSGDSLFVEVYYSIPEAALTYEPDTAGLKAGVDITLTVARADSLLLGNRWLVPHTVNDTAKITRGMNLIGMTNMMLAEGEYTLKMVARDRYNSERVDSLSLKLPIRTIGTQHLTLSDLELASTIRSGIKGSQFYKNTLEVIPNVNALYSGDQKCYLYVEVYNILATGDRSDYTVRTAAYDATRKEIISREKPKKRLAESSVIIDDINVAHLRSGTYTLIVSLLDSSKKALTSVGKKFFIYNPSLGVDSSLLSLSTGISISVFNTMDEPELDREFKWTRHESTESEKKQYEGLTGVDAKRKFMYEFWRRRPDSPREEYLKRIAYSNNNFQVMGREGYKTDRGRVYIVYGPPDDIERHPNDSNARPYEIWTYNNIQGGVIFVFVLRQIGGEYELVHSTHRNELHDENWQQYVVTN